jgi:hypothetical protein
MKTTYDIFRKLPDSDPLWIESVQGFENIKVRLHQLVDTFPGDYFVFDPMTSKIIGTFGSV